MVKVINSTIRCSDSVARILSENMRIIAADDDSGELEQINELLRVKRKGMVKLVHANKNCTSLTSEMDILKEKKQNNLVKKTQMEGAKLWTKEMEEFIMAAD